MRISVFSTSFLAALALLAAPAMAQGGPPANQGGKPTTLDGLSCVTGEIARVNASGVWECSTVVDTLDDQAAVVDDQLGMSWKTIFVTSQVYNGNLGGLAGADFICQQHADGAGLLGRFKAWLSSSRFAPADRFTRSSVPYLDPRYETVAADYAQLTSCMRDPAAECLSAPLIIDEFGNELFSYLIAWTSTLPDGERFSIVLPPETTQPTPELESCVDWTRPDAQGWVGSLEYRDYRWTDPRQPADCNEQARLICVEQ